jgi:hypothetical protein
MKAQFLTFLFFIFFIPFCLCSIAAAQDDIDAYTSRESFDAATTNAVVLDFEGIAPNSGFKQFKTEGSMRYRGLEFRPSGGAKFGPGWVTVTGGLYYSGPIYETTSGAKLIWAPPNQPGNAFLDVTLPAGVTAIGTDLWTAQPLQSGVEVTVTTADGKTRTETIKTPARPANGFIGFTSRSAITSLRFALPKGQTALILDNIATGRAAVGRRSEVAETRANAPVSTTSSVPTTSSIERPSSATALPSVQAPRGVRSGALEGKIAYVRGNTEIRLINPDGSNDRRLWTHPDLHEELGIFELAWRPDGGELAFSSAHEATSSLYLADIYTIGPDGTGLKKLTNPPERAGFGRFPKGSVTVTIRNDQPGDVTSGIFIVYVAGADEPQQVLIPAGSSKTVVFKSVADFGRHAQSVIAMFGKYRWFTTGVDVIAGRNVVSPPLDILGKGYDMLGAFRPVWRSDSSRVSYRSGLCIVSSISPQTTPGEYSFNPIFGGKNPMGTCTWDWGPTATTANQIIYSENSAHSAIYQMTEGGTHPGTKLTEFSDIDYQLLYDLHWLPDASGLLYSTVNLFRDSANIFRYDFATKRTAPVTRLEKEFARAFSISPDGRFVVYEKCPTADDETGCDLWTVGTNGSDPRLLVRNGLRPAWSKR